MFINKIQKQKARYTCFLFYGAATGNRTRILGTTTRCNNHYTIAAIFHTAMCVRGTLYQKTKHPSSRCFVFVLKVFYRKSDFRQ